MKGPTVDEIGAALAAVGLPTGAPTSGTGDRYTAADERRLVSGRGGRSRRNARGTGRPTRPADPAALWMEGPWASSTPAAPPETARAGRWFRAVAAALRRAWNRARGRLARRARGGGR